MSLFHDWVRYETRRQFIGRGAGALGLAALASLGLDGRAHRRWPTPQRRPPACRISPPKPSM